jgi:hypothetical protein
MANPQAAPPAPAPLRPPSQTDMDAVVFNPEARRKQRQTGRAGQVFGSTGVYNPASDNSGLGGASITLGGGY